MTKSQQRNDAPASAKTKQGGGKQDREARLAKQLRANLRKRKAQQRARSEDDTGTA